MKLRRYQLYLTAVLLVFAAAVLFFTGAFNFGGGRTPYLSVKATPPGADWYIDLQWGLTETHYYVLYHGIGPSVANARQADIVLLGDSRALLGFDWRQVEAFSRAHGVRIFNLAIDGATGWEFPLAIMKKHGIHPKAVVFTVPSFVANAMFQAAKEAMDTSWLTSFKYVLSGETLWRVKNAAALVSQPGFTWLYPRQSFNATYRSTLSGCWFRDDWLDSPHMPIKQADAPCLKEYALPGELTQAFKQWGTSVIVGNIPSGGWCPGQEQALAEQIGGEGVGVDTDDLRTYDGSHLDKASSEAYTRRFLEGLAGTEAFRRIVAGRQKAP